MPFRAGNKGLVHNSLYIYTCTVYLSHNLQNAFQKYYKAKFYLIFITDKVAHKQLTLNIHQEKKKKKSRRKKKKITEPIKQVFLIPKEPDNNNI